MAVKKWNVAAIWGVQETTYGTDPSADGSGYAFLKAIDPAFQPTAEVIERPGFTNDMTRNTSVVGPKSWTLSFKTELKASGTPAVSTVAAIASESSAILEAALGTVVRGTGTTVASTSTSTSIVCTSAAGLSKYMAVEILGEIRFITNISTNTITLDRALSLGAPATTTVVNASSLFKRATSGHKSMAFVVKRDGIEYTLLGGYAMVKFSGMSAKGTTLIEVTAMGSDWNVTTKASLPSSDLATITAVKAPVVKGSPFAVAAVEDLISTFDFDPGHKFDFQATTTALQNASGIQLVSAAPKGSFSAYYVAQHLTDFYNGTEQSLSVACGDKTNGFGFYVPKMQYTGTTLANVSSGMVGETIPFAANDNGVDPEWALCLF